jgi:hypothetical protein
MTDNHEWCYNSGKTDKFRRTGRGYNNSGGSVCCTSTRADDPVPWKRISPGAMEPNHKPQTFLFWPTRLSVDLMEFSQIFTSVSGTFMKTSSRDPMETLISMGNIKADRCSFIDDWEDDDVPIFLTKIEIRTGILSIMLLCVDTTFGNCYRTLCSFFGPVTNVIRRCVFGKKVKLKTNISQHLEANYCISVNLRVREARRKWRRLRANFTSTATSNNETGCYVINPMNGTHTADSLSLLFCLIPNNPSAISTESPAGGRDLSEKQGRSRVNCTTHKKPEPCYLRHLVELLKVFRLNKRFPNEQTSVGSWTDKYLNEFE